MPLHLLSKKSWNVYAPDNIAKVKADEAVAAAHEEEQDRVLQVYDSEKRLALLRGEEAPPPPELQPYKPSRKPREEEYGTKIGRERKRKRIAGEDDTDRDLREAREEIEGRRTGKGMGDEGMGKKTKTKTSDAPIVDYKGHINLFPVDAKEQAKAEKNKEVEAEKAGKARELEDQYTMRLSNAAGRDGFKERPWYASGAAKKDALRDDEDKAKVISLYADEKNAWGRPDPNRPTRDKARIINADPMAFMSKAQTQLKKAEIDREQWVEQKKLEMERLRREAGRADKRERKERERREREKRSRGGVRHEDVDELEGFSLDGPVENSGREKMDRDRRRNRRDRSRSRERKSSHRPERKRSRDRPGRLHSIKVRGE
ncbi:hypothetical protein EJ08DRAFT_645045 [Tothia fuscella]|uniref:CBF1-interacting co-repressor CIR N-terminal domain-containing protein n=1 Tax=Tothia fuscella TaxID=1048955 RepID=A0A9P4P329_9PEZI|nr:hypothetical protein EJ08DRAFT_645045 [Tothia fuscella]